MPARAIGVTHQKYAFLLVVKESAYSNRQAPESRAIQIVDLRQDRQARHGPSFFRSVERLSRCIPGYGGLPATQVPTGPEPRQRWSLPTWGSRFRHISSAARVAAAGVAVRACARSQLRHGASAA